VLKVKRVPVPLGTLAISIILSIQVNRIMEFESLSKIGGLIYKLGGVDSIVAEEVCWWEGVETMMTGVVDLKGSI
jgi:hypothetical protein